MKGFTWMIRKKERDECTSRKACGVATSNEANPTVKASLPHI